MYTIVKYVWFERCDLQFLAGKQDNAQGEKTIWHITDTWANM